MSASDPELPGPPMTVAEVLRYLRGKYSIDVIRQTVYHWMDRGRGLESLQYVVIPNKSQSKYPATIRVTCTQWIDEFVERSGGVGQIGIAGRKARGLHHRPADAGDADR